MSKQETLAQLRRDLAQIQSSERMDLGDRARFTFGIPELDEALGGGLPCGAVHEIFASNTLEGYAATGITLAMVLRATKPDSTIVWVRQEMNARELGEVYPSGLMEWGMNPSRIILVKVKDAISVLRAGHEALKCAALGAVILEPWGQAAAFDLTATRRLTSAATRTSISTFLLRISAQPEPSAALTRWQARALPSIPLEAEAPGYPIIELNLLRHRAGFPPDAWIVEWDRDLSSFRQPALSRPVATLSRQRSRASTAQEMLQRAG
ncbi:ImuA family protein [Terrihabitans sp. B22-R8]|uniref:ImuA family protein n=1 Tax=Terrihabitans sp. B22-R8 TaxID=3425128 RepID=UPI00403CEA89